MTFPLLASGTATTCSARCGAVRQSAGRGQGSREHTWRASEDEAEGAGLALDLELQNFLLRHPSCTAHAHT
eukprot:m.792381 g.792381  ORF g.792381 m.792381 type:complete len:71 (-) comp59220_c0_seq14:91-303(-)